MERVTTHHLLNFTQAQAQRHAAEMGRAQLEVTSGIRIHRPSDDPRGQQIVIERRAALQQFNTRLASISDARARLNTAHQAVRDSQQLIVQVKSLAMQARQATSEQETATLANEIEGKINDLLRLANTLHEGRSLFSGAATGQDAFSRSASGTIEYQGSDVDGSIYLANYGTIKTEYSGASVFGSVDGGADVFQTLTQLVNDIRNTAGLSNEDRDAELGNRIGDLDRIGDHLLNVIGEQSVTLSTLDSLQEETENFALQAEETLALTEGTDYAKAALTLQSAQTLLQYSLASTAKLFEISLLNFLA